jgi:hypothetical protein
MNELPKIKFHNREYIFDSRLSELRDEHLNSIPVSGSKLELMQFWINEKNVKMQKLVLLEILEDSGCTI